MALPTQTLNELSLCSGYGGITLGLKLANPNIRAVCYVEREAFPASILVARMEEKALDPAPIWDEVETFDGRPWHRTVDIVTAGFPCQPWSVAGKRKGTSDERWIWPEIFRIIREVQPTYVFLENVPGLLAAGLGHVLSDLAIVGYDAEWGVFSAAECGAPHLRERLFILGYLANANCKRLQGRPLQGCERQDERPLGTGGSTLGPFPPGKRAHREWQEVRATAPYLEPSLCGVVDGTSERVDQLRALGNGVVPVVVAYAFSTLVGRVTGLTKQNL